MVHPTANPAVDHERQSFVEVRDLQTIARELGQEVSAPYEAPASHPPGNR